MINRGHFILTATMNRQVMALHGDQLRLPQLEMELRSKQRRKDEIEDKISCLELEIENEELLQRIDENNRRIESARQAQNELRSRFANTQTKKCRNEFSKNF